jgi:hypothetical protein
VLAGWHIDVGWGVAYKASGVDVTDSFAVIFLPECSMRKLLTAAGGVANALVPDEVADVFGDVGGTDNRLPTVV